MSSKLLFSLKLTEYNIEHKIPQEISSATILLNFKWALPASTMTERTPTPREEEEEKMDLDSIYSKIQQQMRADRELTNMLVDKLKHELLQAFKQKAQETSHPEQQPQREDNRPNHQRDYPDFSHRSFVSRPVFHR